MRVLFLDLDGPLHPTEAIQGLAPGIDRLPVAARERMLFRWLPHLESLLEEHPDVGIVVHSAWRRYASNSELREVLGPLADRFLGVTSTDITRHAGIEEIARRFGIDTYLIVDDALEEFPAGCPQLCAVDPNTGIAACDVQERIRGWLQETAQHQEEPALALAPRG